MVAITGERPVINERFQQAVDACRDQFDKITEGFGRVTRLDSVTDAPQNLKINLGRILAAPADQASIEARLNRSSTQSRQISNVLAQCIPESGSLDAGRLAGLQGQDLAEVIGEFPKEKTSVKENMRATVEKLGFFVNHRILGKSQQALAGTRPTADLLAARATRNNEIKQQNQEIRSKTAEKFANFLQKVGTPDGVKALATLFESVEFKHHVARFPQRLANVSDANVNDSATGEVAAENVVNAAPKSASDQQKIVQRHAESEAKAPAEVPTASPEATLAPLSMPRVAPTVAAGNNTVSVDSQQTVKDFLKAAWLADKQNGSVEWHEMVSLPELEDLTESKQNSAITATRTPQATSAQTGVTSASSPAAQSVKQQPRDWITLSGRVMSAVTLLALAYSYFSQQGDVGDIIDQVANFTKFA